MPIIWMLNIPTILKILMLDVSKRGLVVIIKRYFELDVEHIRIYE